jgi:hypothetical protein
MFSGQRFKWGYSKQTLHVYKSVLDSKAKGDSLVSSVHYKDNIWNVLVPTILHATYSKRSPQFH